MTRTVDRPAVSPMWFSGPPRHALAKSGSGGDKGIVAATLPDFYLAGAAPDQSDFTAVEEVVAAVQGGASGRFMGGPRRVHDDTRVPAGR